MLTEITIKVVTLIEQKYRDAEFRHHEWLIKQKAAAIEAARRAKLEAERREKERLEKLERERIERLIADAERLRRAQAIRAYVAEVMTLVSESGRDQEPAIERWRAWALDQADRIDPVISGAFIRALDDSRTDS